MAKSGAGARLSIGELAERFGLATHVLRHWEDVGVLTPAERVSGRRRYHEEHVARVALVIRCKEAGFRLADIREMLDAPSSEERRIVLEQHHRALQQRIAEAEAARALVEHALNCPMRDFTTCRVFQRLADVMTPWRGDGSDRELDEILEHHVRARADDD